VSLGRLEKERILKLRECGASCIHHNIETSPEYFPRICSTHTFDERIRTARAIKEAGMPLCCGAIFGMGESWEDRLKIALILRELDADSIPLNFLIPVKGTALEKQKPLSPPEILRIIALFRFVLPEKTIRVCAGREYNLRDLQSWIFYAGANGMMIGGYLTQSGRSVEQDMQMLKDLKLKVSE
jgi:biotin synthase